MQHKQGEDRNQMVMFSQESAIAKDSFVRVVDAFVDAIDLDSFGFTHVQCKEEGRPGKYLFRRYTTPDCKECCVRDKCTKNKVNGRAIDRTEFADIVEANAKRVNENPGYYRQRQQITEHMFGTLKRQRDFTYTLLRGKGKFLGEVGLMFIGYNLSRCISIMGAEKLIRALKDKCLFVFRSIRDTFLSPYNGLKYYFYKMAY